MAKTPLENTSYSSSFGRYLKTIREQRGISLNAIAGEICIGLWVLSLIEAEDHERLPDEVYVRGILRAYAKTIGVDPDDIIERYKLNRDIYQRNAKAEADILRSGRQSFPRMLLALGVLFLIVWASLHAFYTFVHDENALVTGRTRAVAKMDQPELPAPEAPSPAVTVQSDSAQQINDQGRLRLKIEVVSETTINVQIDDLPYTKYRLRPNDEVQLEASMRFNLLISDADGVRLRLNGQPVTIPGEPGQSVNLVLSHKDGN